MKKIFKKVIDSNIEMFANQTKMKAEAYAALKLSDNLNEEETRKIAIKFFIQQLSESLSEKLETHL